MGHLKKNYNRNYDPGLVLQRLSSAQAVNCVR